jgi:hypothetical protein
VELSRSSTWIERIAPSIARISAASFVIANGSMLYMAGSNVALFNHMSLPLILLSTLSLFGAIGAITLLQWRGHVDTEFWGGLWTGAFGRSAFKVAQKLLGKRKITTAVTHRATELSLGLAAEQLFDSLPRETRKELSVLPDVMRRLQEDAQLLRKKHDELSEALAACTAGTPEYMKVREMRDEMHTKLGETIAALETIRLNLLRLHAGAGSVQSITTNINVAAEVSAAVERLVSAHEEVDRTLKFPRTIAPSPA